MFNTVSVQFIGQQDETKDYAYLTEMAKLLEAFNTKPQIGELAE